MPSIVFKNVDYAYVDANETFEALEDINLEIRDGEFLCLVGHSGCGKSTMLSLIAGLEHPTRGEILIDGKPITGPGPDRSIVFQNYSLFPWQTAVKNVRFAIQQTRKGASKEEADAKARELLDSVGVGEAADRYPFQLSGGMRQRVGIARAYCSGPDVILMDEPFGHLDAQTRWLMQEEVIRLWQRERKTVVFVTNNIEEEVYLADRVLVLGNCPTSVQHEFVVDLPRPRDYVSPDFMRLRQAISAVIERTR